MFEAMNAEKLLRPIFGCKVGQSIPIGMKLEPDMWHHLLDLHRKLQIDISKHVDKKPGKLLKIQNTQKIIAKKIRHKMECREVYSGLPMYQIWRIYFDL